MLVIWSFLLSLILNTVPPNEIPQRRELINFARDGLQFDTGLTLRWADSSPDCRLIALPPQEGETQRVLWQNVYLNADLTVITHSDEEMITYEWIIYPGGWVDDIVIESITPHGSFRGTGLPEEVVGFTQPEAWQDQGGFDDHPCEVSFVWRGSQLQLALGEYEPGQVLNIRWNQHP